MAYQFLPVLMVIVVAVLTASGMMAFAALVGQRSRTKSTMKHQSYESGVPLLDRALKRISVKFYLVAIVFVVLDVEVAFLYPWALTYRDFVSRQVVAVFWDMLAFTALLAVAYVYLWRKGTFDWVLRRPTLKPSADRGDS